MIDSDQDAWEAYPQHRWIFNKLEVALRQGFHAGPACSRVTFEGKKKVVIRPIYNLFGMGVGAHITELDSASCNPALLRNEIVPIGHFWCEYFEGPHYSIDYHRTRSPVGSIFAWEPFHAMEGLNDESNLHRFNSWRRVTIPTIKLPHFLNDITDVEHINIECKGDKIFEIHLRTGNDILHGMPVGSWAFPVWNDQEYLTQNPAFVPNFYSDINLYKSAQSDFYRLGFLLKKP